VLDFLLVLIELFLPALPVEVLWADIDQCLQDGAYLVWLSVLS